MSSEAVAPPRAEVALRSRTALRRVLGPVGRALVVRPVREGRLRLAGLGRVERQISLLALVAIGGLLVSLLAAEAWRDGALLPLGSSLGQYHAVPANVLPVTLLAFFLAWMVLVWGASLASNWITLLVAVLFLLLNSTLGKPPTFSLGESGILAWGPTVTRVAYFTVPALMIAYSVMQVRESWAKKARLPILALVVVALGGFFGSLLAIHVAQVRQGIVLGIPLLLDGAILATANVLVPLVVLSAIALVDFSYSVAQAVASPIWALRATLAKVVVAAFIVLKLWIQLARHWSEWVAFVPDHPVTTLSVLGGLVLLGVFAFVLRRRSNPAPEGVKERLIYGGTLTLSAPLLVLLAGTTLAGFLLTQAGWLGAAAAVRDVLPREWLSLHGDTVAWVVFGIAGVALLARGRIEFGVGALLFAAWTLLTHVSTELGRPLGWNDPLADIVVTLGAAVWLVARWRRVDAAGAVRLGALVVFSWLVFTRGDFVSIVAGWFGLPAVVLLVFGILYTLLADSAFASGHSRRLPRTSRPLLWVGYLLLSVTLLHWVQVTHSSDVDFSANIAYNGFFLIGIPLGVWLVTRRPFQPAHDEA